MFWTKVLIAGAALMVGQSTPKYVAVAIPGGGVDASLSVPPRIASDRIAAACIDAKWSVSDRSEYRVICESDEGAALLGGSGSSRHVAQFELISSGDGTRVRGRSIFRETTVLGKVSDSAGVGEGDMLSMLHSAGATFPVGSIVGAEGLGLSVYPRVSPLKFALAVGRVKPGSPAAIAGILPADEIRRVSNKGFSDENEFLQLVVDAGPEAVIDVVRNGKRLKLTLKR